MLQFSIGGAAFRRHLLVLATLVLSVALIYGRTGSFGYSGIDDESYILNTEAVRAGLHWDGVMWALRAFHMSNWHPLTWLSHMLDVTLFGVKPGPAHLVNAGLHALTGVLVYVFALRVLRHWLVSFAVALIFVVHPLHVESVAWIAERKDLLCSVFFLLSLLAYLRYAAQPGVRRYLVVLLCFVLALMAKPMAVTLPLILLLLDCWPLNRHNDAPRSWFGQRVPAPLWLLVEKVPLLLLSLVSGLITMAAQSGALASIDKIPLGYRAANAAIAYATYLRDSVMPTRLAAFYPLDPINYFGELLPSLCALTLLSAAALLLRRRYPWLLAGWLWFLVMLLPVIGLLQVGAQSHADRYMYLPSLGLLLAIGASLTQLNAMRLQKTLANLLPVAVFLAFLSWVQVGYWSGPHMVFGRVLQLSGDSYQAHAGLASYFLDTGQLDKARAHALNAMRLSQDLPVAENILAAVLLTRKEFAAAEPLLRDLTTRFPTDAEVLNNLGVALLGMGRAQEARIYFLAARAADPQLSGVTSNLRRVGG